MKIYIFENGVTLVGKAWEVREKLREYAKDFDTVEQWVQEKGKKVNSNLTYLRGNGTTKRPL